ncbi:MAG: efflux RND transporter periplasmic adaptor subunit [Acidobacteriia bacterium]|nr:efflux RND transporter periplasmic adaptor subunit [Terriglobia bacterium]
MSKEIAGPSKRRPQLERQDPPQSIPVRNLVLGGLLIWLGVALGCSKEPAEKEPVVSVQTVVARETTIKRIVTADAILFPLHQAALTPKISAPVREFHVQRGSPVHRGQLLAVLENSDLAAAETENKGIYEQAQASYESTTAANLPEEMQKAELDVQQTKEALDAVQKVYESRQTLYRQGALPRKELDQALVAFTQARAQYEISLKHFNALKSVGKPQGLKAAKGQLTSAEGKYLASKAQLGYSEIRSPIDGVVTDRPFYPGEMANAGTPLITVMDISQIIARAHIPQQEAAVLKVGNPATISGPGISDDLSGKVTVVSPAVDPNSTTVEIWVQAANAGHQLKPGETVQVSMVAQEIPKAVVVPAVSILTAEEGSTSVMVAGSDGRAHLQKVTVGIRQGGEVQVTQGLKSGERVVTTGAYGLPDNTKIKFGDSSASQP